MRDPLDPMVWLAVFAAVSAATLVADICVGAAVTIAEGRLEPQQRLDMLLTNWTVALSNTCLALAIAAVVAARPEGGLLLVPPTVLLMAAYRAYLSERRRNSELEFLYEATRTLSRSSEIVPELEALLARTAAAFRVGAVELVLFSAEPNRSARSSLNRDGDRRMLEPIDEPLAESLRSLAAGLSGPVETERIHDSAQRGYFRWRGMETGVRGPAPWRGRLRRPVRHRRPRERGPQLLGGGPPAARDAHRQRDRRAPVRPPRAGGAPARVAPARARAQGPVRLAHAARQPLALPQPSRARAAEPPPGRVRAAARHRRVQGDQRQPRPPRRRRAAARGRRPPARMPARGRHRGAPRRRRVRAAARPQRAARRMRRRWRSGC